MGLWPRQLRREDEGLEEGGNDRSRLLVRLHEFLGFAVDFCKSGGDIVQRFWQPLGQSDFGGIIAQLPDNVDAIYLGLGGTDAINFLNQYQQAGEKTRLIGGTIMADQTVLTAKVKRKTC